MVYFADKGCEQQVAQHDSILVSVTVVKMETSASVACEYPWNGQELQTY